MFPQRPGNSATLRSVLVLAGLLVAGLIAPPAIAASEQKPPPAQQKPPPPPPENPEQSYERCMSLAAEHPEQAFAQAIQWRNHGGGYAAEHCEAASLYGLRQYDEAARRLHDIAASNTAAAPEVRVQAYDQAAQAWIMAQQPKEARTEYDAALKLAPKDVQLLLGRAEADGLSRDYWSALDDLNAVLDIDRKNAEALVLRAAAYRHVDAIDLAADDANRAVTLSPKFPDAYLERGAIAAAKGDYPSARKDWDKVLELAPDSYSAEQARENLTELDKIAPAGAAAPAPPAKPPAKK